VEAGGEREKGRGRCAKRVGERAAETLSGGVRRRENARVSFRVESGDFQKM
jgi:hypothetical protein